jgi:transposase
LYRTNNEHRIGDAQAAAALSIADGGYAGEKLATVLARHRQWQLEIVKRPTDPPESASCLGAGWSNEPSPG